MWFKKSNKSNKIIFISNTEISGYTYTEELIIKAKDGNYYLESELPPLTEEELLKQAKAERAEAVSKIIVEVDGMKFDGDETAQTRMGRTISAAQALGVDSSEKRTWVLADNTVAEPTIAQLAQALKLAGDEQTKLWTIPYEESIEEATLAKVGI